MFVSPIFQTCMLNTGLHIEKRGSAKLLVDEEGRGPTQRALAAERQSWEGTDVKLQSEPRFPNVRFLRLV